MALLVVASAQNQQIHKIIDLSPAMLATRNPIAQAWLAQKTDIRTC